jgi:hypothetical protein
MARDVETRHVEKLRLRKFSIEAVLMAYVRYIVHGEFTEEMFCEALKTTTTAIDIYNKLKNYLDEAQI